MVLAGALLVSEGVAVDQLRLDLAQRLAVHPEPFGGVVAHVVLDDVGPLDEPVQHRHALRVLEVEGDRFLVPVADHGDVVAEPGLVIGRVDLYDPGAQLGEDPELPQRMRSRSSAASSANWRSMTSGE